MASDSVCVEIATVDFEVEPVEAESLRKAQRGFAVVGVNAVCGGLVEQCDDAEAEDERDECCGPSALNYASWMADLPFMRSVRCSMLMAG